MTAQFKLLIDGELVDGVSTFDVVNPATEEAFAQCPKADEALLNRAVAAAKAAFPAWAAKSFDERAGYINRLADALEARVDDFARLLTSEQGKPLDQAAYEIMGSVFVLRAFANMRLTEKTLRDENGNTVIEHRTPLGVCASITPWNFPVVLLMNKLGPCLIAGNTMVAKPAPTTPLTTLLFGALARDILPKGVLNIVCDQNELGPLITGHPDIAKVAFTGSTGTGKKVMASAAEGVKRVTLELGGKGANLLFADADAKAVERSVRRMMENTGQSCNAPSRLLVERSVYDQTVARAKEVAEGIKVGPALEHGPHIGPVVNKRQWDQIQRYIQIGIDEGARLVTGGPGLPEGFNRGFYVKPTIFADVTPGMTIEKEEIFGPVLSIIPFETEEEAVRIANDTPYGLTNYVQSGSPERCNRLARQLRSGMVEMNGKSRGAGSFFGGVKQSGRAREGGIWGIEEFLEPKGISGWDFSAG